MRRFGIFLDGTWNTVADNTNVWRLCSLCSRHGDDGVEQLIHYDAGVGTVPGQALVGGALGLGLADNVVEAYRCLIGNYSPGDEVFLFGFSRGAFTARSLAGLIARCGLLLPGSPLAVERVFARYRKGLDLTPLYTLAYQARHGRTVFDPEERLLLRYSLRIPIKMIGIWDTVGALGIPFGDIPGLSRRRFLFHNTRLSNIFENAYQALAVDEHRRAFAPSLWTRFTPKVPDEGGVVERAAFVEQRWFVGAHANVGGGCPDDLLPQVPLRWLMTKAHALGFAFRFEIELDGREHLGPISDSYAGFLNGLYKVATLGRRHHRIIGYPRTEKATGFVDTENETVDGTVFDRWREDTSYRPENLAEWGRRLGVDSSGLQGPLRAGDASIVEP